MFFSIEFSILRNDINFLADQADQFRFTIWNKIEDRYSSKTPDQEFYSQSVKFLEWQ